MIRIPFTDIVAKIQEKTGLSQDEILKRIDDKSAQLSGLVSKDGAAHIIANELGVKIFEHGGRQKIKDLYVGMRNVDVVGKVLQVYEPKEFSRSDGTAGKVGSLLIGDETGQVRVVCWGSQADAMRGVSAGTIVLVNSAMIRENNRNFKELHLNDQSRLVISPKGEAVEVKARAEAVRKAIKDLAENDENIEVLATIVQIFDPKFFEVCPECGKRVQNREGHYLCDVHKEIQPQYSYILNVFLDDGTENVRCVFFKNQAERLVGKDSKDMLMYRESPEKFEEMKTHLLGQLIKIVGRVKKNQFFDRLELNAQLVFTDPDAGEELARLKAAAS